MTQEALALRLNVALKHINEIINEKSSISPDMALRLEHVFWWEASYWMSLQSKYDELTAREAQEASIKFQVPIFERFKDCYDDLVKLNYCPKTRIVEEKIQALLDFFQVVSLESVSRLPVVDFRKSSKVRISTESVAAWLKVWEKEAEKIEVGPFDIEKLKNMLPELRTKTRSPESLSKYLKLKWEEVGIKFVFVKLFKNAPVNGATRWIWSTPVIQLSDRWKDYGKLLFTLFHELWHVTLHGGEAFLDMTESSNWERKEYEADLFAQNNLIPEEFRFSEKLNDLLVHPSKIPVFAREVWVDEAYVAWRVMKESGKYNIPAINSYSKQVAVTM